jgi:hypothetical protein
MKVQEFPRPQPNTAPQPPAENPPTATLDDDSVL